MKRTQQNKTPTAILTSDWHLREDQPTCRMDNFRAIQWKKLEFIAELQRKHNWPLVIHAGDLFHHWKPSPWLLSETMGFLPSDFYTIYGQHDLPQHNMELAYKSGINTLATADRLEELFETNFGEEPNTGSFMFFNPSKVKGFADNQPWSWQKIEEKINPTHYQEGMQIRLVSVWHNFTWDGKKVPWPGCNEMTAEEVLDEYPQFDLIVTGDYHKGFTYRKDGRLLVNPGCLTRQVADYKDYKPRVYLWYAEDNTVEPVHLPIEKDAVSREHIEVQENHDRRITAFIERLSGEWETTVSFEKNMDRFLKTNDVPKQIKEIIYKATE